jgi:gliding motility-associated-like protein
MSQVDGLCQFNAADFNTVGSAVFTGGGCYRLTPEVIGQGGAIWYRQRITLASDFDIKATVYLGVNDQTGADGVAFVLQPLSNTFGGSGGGLGYSGLSPSLAVEMDTWQNTNDPVFDHIALMANGVADHASPNNLQGPSELLPNQANAEDGVTRPVRIVWTAATKRFQFYFNNVLKIDRTVDIVTDIFGGNPNVYWGFTANTGAFTNEQRVCLTDYQLTPQRVCSVPDFQQPPEQCLSGNRFNFINTTVEQGSVQYTWRFGDGSVSTQKNPVKTYAAAGLYDVKLVVSGDGGCLDSVTRQVRVRQTPAAGFQVDNAGQCLRSNLFSFTAVPQPSGLSVSRLWRFGDGSVSTQADPTCSYTSPGSRTVRLTVTSSEGCADSSERILQVYAMPVAAFSVVDTVQCLNRNDFRFTDISVAGAGTLRSWMLGDGSVGAGQSVSRVYAAAGDYDVRLTLVSAEGCRDSVTRRMHVLAVPKAAFDVDDADQCLRGNLFSFTNLSQANGTTAAYQWSFGDGATSGVAAPGHAYTTAGVRVVSLLALSTEGCRDSVSRSVEVLSHPVAAFDAPADQCLRGNQFSFTSRSTLAGGSISETRWSFGDGGTATGLQSQRAYAQPGVFPVSLFVLGANGCRDTLTRSVSVHPHPSVQPVASPAAQCLSGNRFDLQVASTIVSGSVTSHGWDFGDGTGAVGNVLTHSYSRAGLFQGRVWALSDRGCGDTTAFTTDVRPEPNAVFSAEGSLSICQGASVLLRSGGEMPGRRHHWLLDGVPIAGATDSFFIARQAGAYRLQVTLGICQRTSAPVSVVVNPLPAMSADTPAARCLTGNSFTFRSRSNVVPGTVTHAWDLGDGRQAQGPTLTHAYFSAGQFRVRLMVTTDKGCMDSLFLPAVVYAEPEVIVTPGPMREICAGDSLSLISGSLPGSGTIRSLQWSLDGRPLAGVVGGTIVVRQAGQYRLEVENSNGCRTTGGDMRLVVNPLPAGSLSQPILPVICEGSALVLNAAGADAYAWERDGRPIAGAVGDRLPVTQPGVYTVWAVSAKGCRAPIPGSVTAVLQRRPTIAFRVDDRCVGLPVAMVNQSDTLGAGPLTWRWDFGDGGLSTAFAPTYTYARSGTRSVTLRLLSPNCPAHDATLTRALMVDSPRSAVRYRPVNAVSNLPLPLDSRGFGVQYRWAPSVGLNRYDTARPVFRHDSEVDFRVRIETSTGCVTVDSLLVRMFPGSEIYVPKAFSPNGDGHNDRLEIFLAGISEISYFRIYNRWGQQVYETRTPVQPWDGVSRGVPQPSDTYVWVVQGLTETGSRLVRRGQFVLIR